MNNDKYVAPTQAHIGHVHLKVSDLEKAIEFYSEVLGFEVTMRYGSQAAFLSVGGYHHHIGLNTWHSKGGLPAPTNSPGLYHTAILYPDRKELAEIYKRITEAGYPVSGASDHGVSEAIYLNDPDGNGVELYYDRPEQDWPRTQEGGIDMYASPLDLQGLLEELDK